MSCISSGVDAAYVASRAVTHDLCTAIWPEYTWEAGLQGTELADACGRLDAIIGCPGIADEDKRKLTQRRLNKAVAAKRVEQWSSTNAPSDRTRRNAYAAKGAGKLYELTPSVTLDMKVESSDFGTNVACRLGVDVMEAGETCPKCGMLLDAQWIHPQSCMAGGDASRVHNAVRDVYEDYCRRGGMRPVHEAPELLRNRDGEITRERPADILVIPNLALATELPDGGRAVRTERICFDFAVINALGPDHWSRTTIGSGEAAESYDGRKRRHNGTEARCREQGLLFWPIVFEQQGGCSKAADKATRAIAKAVAEREGRKESVVREEFRQIIAVILARSGAAMIKRRQRPHVFNTEQASRKRRAIDWTMHLA